jgi:hypothetical protein
MLATPPNSECVSAECLALARDAFREFRSRCFWYLRPDLEIQSEHFPLLIRGLRLNGGHAGLAMAERLCR